MTTKKNSINSIRKEIQITHLSLIVIITILFSFGSAIIDIKTSEKNQFQDLVNNSNFIYRLYSFTEDLSQQEKTEYFNELCEELTNVDVISIVDENGIRLYHTNNELIGTKYEGKNPSYNFSFSVFDETGPSGPQKRTYGPIFDDDGNYKGFIMTIVLKRSIRSVTLRTIILFVIITIFAIILEIIISKTVSHRIKQRLLGYEPETFSSMFLTRDNILESVHDGIIAVDKNCEIEYLNSNAKNIIGITQDINVIDKKNNFILYKTFEEVIKSGTNIYGLHETTLDGKEILIDYLCVKQKESVTGAVAVIHDRTEYTKLMEDLSGTKYLVDSMRANNHDFTNKLHVILGLIQIGEYEKAVSYIENISLIQRETLSGVMHCIDNPSFAALLIGKIARASECNVKFIIQEGTKFTSSHVKIPSEGLITIAGNLIDNALEAMNNFNRVSESDVITSKELVFGVYTKPQELLITVSDNGPGISKETGDKIFENGFSTKGTGRGVGLYHTKQLVESFGGKIYYESQVNAGTTFTVKFSAL